MQISSAFLDDCYIILFGNQPLQSSETERAKIAKEKEEPPKERREIARESESSTVVGAFASITLTKFKVNGFFESRRKKKEFRLNLPRRL